MDDSKLIEKLMKKPGLRARIDAKCIDCCYDEKSGLGNWRQQVAACTVTLCPLWDVRAVSKPELKSV